ncbi:MAG: 50S ribosomal protein L18e [Candidatus Bathyarchaeota archaeon]|nr:MAG: 50S ribosomal protein L18e [Candidatus Bathyarchaeota archaeon]
MRKISSSNPHLLKLIRFLRKAAKENNATIWSYVANTLAKPRNRRASINLSQINRHTEKDQVVAVGGKVLGAGTIRHPVTVAAFEFSVTAEKKIKIAKGRCLTLPELVKENPTGSNIKVIR